MSFWKNISVKRKLVILATCVVFLFFLLRSDNAQQINYAIMNDAYEQMEKGNYETAAEEFQQYLDGHSSQIYWKVQAVLNKNAPSTYENVQKALEECQRQLQKEE